VRRRGHAGAEVDGAEQGDFAQVRPHAEQRPVRSARRVPALEYVPQELRKIQSIYGGRPLLNRDFQVATLEREIEDQPYSIVHIASHGQFSSNRKETFVLAYNDRLDLDAWSA